MAIYDDELQKLVVRLVFDGPAMAGKTTNLEQVKESFTDRRRSELKRSAESAAQRTLFLDWLRLDSGLVDGHPLRAHLISVPGQAVFFRRRRLLLAKADGVVFVLEATAEGVEQARPCWESLTRVLEASGRSHVPIVVQANKQDLPNAIDVGIIKSALQLPEHCRVVTAVAEQGTGIRETLVVALRGVANDVQRELSQKGLEAMTGVYEGAEELQEMILQEEREMPIAPVDVVLEQTRFIAEGRLPAAMEPNGQAAAANSNAQAVAGTPASEAETKGQAEVGTSNGEAETNGQAETGTTSGESAEAETASSEVVAVTPSGEAEAPEQVASPQATPSVKPEAASETPQDALPSPATAKEASASELEVQASSGSGSFPITESAQPTIEQTAEPSESQQSTANRSESPTQVAEGSDDGESERQRLLRRISFPSDTVPAGQVWPASTGRDVLRRVPIDTAELRTDLNKGLGRAEGSGRSDALIFEAGLWCLKTSERRRFSDLDQARAELLRIARLKTLLGPLLAPQTVLCVSTGESGSWVWTISPWLATLRSQMNFAAERDDQIGLGIALKAYVDAAISALKLTLAHDVVLDVHPNNFGWLGEHCYYLDDDVSRGAESPSIGYAFLRRVEEYAAFKSAVDTYTTYLIAQVNEFSREERERLALQDAFRETIVTSVEAQLAKKRITSLLLVEPERQAKIVV